MPTATKPKRTRTKSITEDHIERAMPIICNVCKKWCGIPGRELADLEQDCLIQLMSQFGDYDAKRYEWHVWVMLVAQATCRRVWDQTNREPRLSGCTDDERQTIEPSVPDEAHETAIRHETAVRVRNALAKLNSEERNTLTELHGIGDREATNSFAEVGRRLGIGSGQALRLHDAALAKLRGLLSEGRA
jgi:RNA polymerase sigma factor (sigma-70 family)